MAAGGAGDHVLIAPPYIITAGQIDELVSRLSRALHRVQAGLAAVS
jgi:adenosylmethionine-8-amino-7-oxononanoate aminotransferase